jgi:formylglycine-generating enzyme required for sulfatase activity
MGDHVFICYAREDQDFVLKLAANLKERGVPVWLDKWDIPASADWDVTIDNALHDCAQFLIVLSPAAVASGEVRGELRTALDENKPVVPVLYQTCRIPRQLRLIQRVDFTSRGPDDGAALGQVLRALAVRVTPPTVKKKPTAWGGLPIWVWGIALVAALVIGGTIFLAIPTPVPMVSVAAGEFTMGSDEGDPGEKPVHTVYLDGFYIDETEVTNAQYRKCVEAGACDAPLNTTYYDNADYAQHPVVYVSWNDANAYCRSVGKRLPTEAEWEKAARGTDRLIYPWGNTFDGTKLNFADKNTNLDWSDSNWDDGYADTAPVGSYPDGASPYGALDMAGNVWEWVADWYDLGYYDQSPERNPPGPDSGEHRVLRGGSWSNQAYRVRSAARGTGDPFYRSDNVGFRCASGSQ